MSLYRTYRPKTFDDVVGQDHIVTTLSQAVAQNKLSHAYLFAGTRGTGKTSTARILAKILLTHGIEDQQLKDQIIDAVDAGNLTDLTEIDAASNTGVDNIRDLIEKIQFTPVVSAAKVYIIDEVHMLSKGAFNALLKTLEEPPAYAYFILATTELHKIPATIQSRCQRFLFRQIGESDIALRLRYIADQEEIDVEDNALTAIAHHARGGMRDAISLLDQLRSLPKITLSDVRERVGETGHEYTDQVLAAIRSGDRQTIIDAIRKLEEVGVPLENFVRLLLEAVRHDLHAAVKEHRPTHAFERPLDVLLQAVKDVRTAPLPALVLESALLSLCEGLGSASPSPGSSHSPAAPSAPKMAKAPVKAAAETEATSTDAPSKKAPATENSANLTISDIHSRWNDVLELVQPPSARMSLKNGQLHAIENGVLMIRFSSSFHRDKASSNEGTRSLEDATKAILGTSLRTKFMLDSEISGPPPIAREENVDLAAAALDVF
jgi:DNA polymerase III subunit gamma/tau